MRLLEGRYSAPQDTRSAGASQTNSLRRKVKIFRIRGVYESHGCQQEQEKLAEFLKVMLDRELSRVGVTAGNVQERRNDPYETGRHHGRFRFAQVNGFFRYYEHVGQYEYADRQPAGPVHGEILQLKAAAGERHFRC